MPRVTQVEQQKKSKNRFNIFLDGLFAFGADEDLVVSRRLVPGKLLDTFDVESILFEAQVGKLMERIYGLFNVRNRSEKEVRDYLKNLSFKRKVKDQEEISGMMIESTIEVLKRKNMINDARFAKDWVEARRKSKQKGKIALKQELYQKGIDREIIEEVISGQVTVDSDERIAHQALEKKLKSWKNLPDMEAKKKAYEYLMRKGFEYSVVKDVVEKYLKKDYNTEEW